jgi:hypothetical protein
MDKNIGSPYLDLLANALTASIYPESSGVVIRPGVKSGLYGKLRDFVIFQLMKRHFVVTKKYPFDLEKRKRGEDWPMFGYSMIGTVRLKNIYDCLKSAVENEVEGDFVECGVWRGGASIFARAALNELGAYNRKVWAADSFEGMPVQKTQDLDDPALAGHAYLTVSVEDVKDNFRRFNLLDNVTFLKGWFADTLPSCGVKKISVLRLDGDYYSSTMDTLEALYSKVAIGGYVIIDDYNSFVTCKKAVTDFLRKGGLSPTITGIDRHAVYWRKEA